MFTLRLWAMANSFPPYTPVAGLGQYRTRILIRTDTVWVNGDTLNNSGLKDHMPLDTWTNIALTRDSNHLVVLWIGKTQVAYKIISGTIDRDRV